ncbi:MAG: hypothetical protein ACREAA_07390 [Candidatus Polarisedimenticolia bacterium]
MKHIRSTSVLLGSLFLIVASAIVTASAAEGMAQGDPKIQSMSALAFGPQGILFIGDGKAGAVVALDLGDTKPRAKDDALSVPDIEAAIAARLGTAATEIMIHDMAVNPISQNVYLSVSRGRGAWNSHWALPNHLADAVILLKVAPDDGTISVVETGHVSHAKAALPNAVANDKKHPWLKETSLRTEAITDLAYADGTLYVAGMSNEEFSSTMWKIPFPFRSGVTATTLEIFHGAHGKYETDSPVRAFLPYSLKGESHLLAAYLCTPLVTFKTADVKEGAHLKGRTIGEFGSGNYPLDMVTYTKEGTEKLLIANSSLPFMVVDPKDIEAYDGSITTEVKGYLAGVTWEPRSGSGIIQMDNFNGKYILALQRLPGGKLSMVSMDVRRF